MSHSSDVADSNFDLTEVVPVILKKAVIHNGVVRGLHQVAKALEISKLGDPRRVRVCFLAESCNEEAYKALVRALCDASGTPLIDVPDALTLGQWAGLCKIDKEERPRKIVKASCVAITDFGEESGELESLKRHIAAMKPKAVAA